MKKTVITIIGALMALMACQRQENDTNVFTEEQTECKTLTFNASIIKEETKVAVATTGVVTWTTGDSFAIYNTDGTKFEATIQSGIGSADGVFTCTTFTGTLDTSAPAVYPYAYAGAKGKVVVPQYIARDDKIPAVMASEVSMTGETVNVDFHHIMAVLDFTLQDVPAYARALKLFTEDTGVKLSGTFSVNGELNGVTADSGNDNQVVYFPYKTAYGAEATTKVYFAVPAGSYTTLKFAVLDGDEDAVENTTKNLNSTTRALAANSYRAMPDFNVRTAVGSARDKFVKVQGVKWAKGNLRYWGAAGNTSGWQDGWNVYDAQWKTQYALAHLDNTKTGIGFYLNDSDYLVLSNPDHWDYFVWGQLGTRSRYDDGSIVRCTSPNTEMGGVIRYDTVGKVEEDGKYFLEWTTMSSVAGLSSSDVFSTTATVTISETVYNLYGDIAYWASKGQFRTPTKTEINTLTTSAGTSQQAGYYITSGSGRVYGNLYRTCASWESPSDNTTAIELTDADLESGVFIPKIGVGYTGADTYDGLTIMQYNNWSVYRSSTHSATAGYPYTNVSLACGGANSMALYEYSGNLGGAKVGRTNYGEPIRAVFIGD
ncbi:MAG: hypothetical protein J5835_06735 [Bacteroidales bacterium]|nr:hypothetical protein [Bacteroidales bacterium]